MCLLEDPVEPRISSEMQANFGVGCSWPSCRLCSDWRSWEFLAEIIVSFLKSKPCTVSGAVMHCDVVVYFVMDVCLLLLCLFQFSVLSQRVWLGRKSKLTDFVSGGT